MWGILGVSATATIMISFSADLACALV